MSNLDYLISIVNNKLILALICFGVVFAIVFFHLITTFKAIPQENRQYHDKLPLGFKILWPLIHCMTYYFGQKISTQQRQQLLIQLKRGSAEYILSAEQFYFAHGLSGLLFAVFGYYLAALIDVSPMMLVLIFGILGLSYPTSWLKKRIKKREDSIFKSLPYYLDMITLSVEAGSNFIGALTQATASSKPGPLAPPEPLQEEFTRVIRDIRAGKPKLDAIRDLRVRVHLPGISGFVSAVAQSEKMGSPLGRALRAQADQRRFERFAKAEKLGLEAPVKLLGPLIIFIFPTTFIIITFLVVVKMISTGIFTSPTLQFLMSNPLVLLQKIAELF